MLAATTSPSPHFPALYFPAAIGLVALLVETWLKRRQPWAMPAAVLYATVFAWYFADLFMTPADYDFLPDSLLNISYGQVAAFLAIYRLVVPRLTKRFVLKAKAATPNVSLPPQVLFTATVLLWMVLLTCGVVLMHGDLIGALFPISARAGELMWGRGAAGDAGASGFLVSAGSYVYALVCASFGVWLVMLRPPPIRWLAATLILVSWPFFLLSGTRSNFLAVCLPLFFAYLLFGRQHLWVRITCLAATFCLLNFVLLVVITYRGVGFQEILAPQSDSDTPKSLSSHQGLNMIQELCFANIFSQTHASAYGGRYLQEAVNVVPRAIWPSKPMLGIDYAVWRGFGGGDSDIGVVATISSGMIGGGVLNFGLWFGPVAPALLMAVWTALLARWWVQRASLLRGLLFLVGLGLTFNLGRDITLLVLWPIVFGYLIVRVAERLAPRKRQPRRAIASAGSQPTAGASLFDTPAQRTPDERPSATASLSPVSSTRMP